jgi:hypothetical protein
MTSVTKGSSKGILIIQANSQKRIFTQTSSLLVNIISMAANISMKPTQVLAFNKIDPLSLYK